MTNYNDKLTTRVKLSYARLLRNPVHALAFGLGAGLMRSAPGTWGTLMAVPFYGVMQLLPWPYYTALVCALCALGVWVCARTARDLGIHDDPGIVFDEMVGYWITMLAVPATWLTVIVGFILFRVMDIWKPWPIRHIDQRVSGGLGIMLDDILAGVYACLVLHLGLRLAGNY